MTQMSRRRLGRVGRVGAWSPWWGVYCVQASWRRTHSATVFDGDQMLLVLVRMLILHVADGRWLRLQCARPVMEIVLPYVADCSIT